MEAYNFLQILSSATGNYLVTSSIPRLENADQIELGNFPGHE